MGDPSARDAAHQPLAAGDDAPARPRFPQIKLQRLRGNPAHKQFPQIKVQRLRGNPDHVRITQLWGRNLLN